MADPKTYPSSQDVTFLLCEEVRREHTGKLILIGVYPAEQIVIQNAKPPDKKSTSVAAIEALAFVFMAKNGLGTFASRMIIEAPNGKRTIEGPVKAMEMRERASATMTGYFRPFPISEFGEHRVTLFLDDVAYSFPFEIRKGTTTELKKDKKAGRKKQRKQKKLDN